MELVVGVIYRGRHLLDGIISAKVKADGLDVAKKIAAVIKSSPHYDQLRAILLGDVIVAETSVINMRSLFKATKLPVIAIMEKKLDFVALSLVIPKSELKNLKDAGKIYGCRIGGSKVYLQVSGISISDARRIVEMTSLGGHIPEALRLARVIGKKLSTAE